MNDFNTPPRPEHNLPPRSDYRQTRVVSTSSGGGWLAAGVVLEGLARLAGPQSLTGALLPLGFALYFAFEANNLRRWHLAGKGFALRAVASGRDLAECEHRFFTGWAGEETAVAPRRRQATAGLAAPVSPAGDPGAVIGLFPRPGGY